MSKKRRIKKPTNDFEVTHREVELYHREPEIQTREPVQEEPEEKPKIPVVPMLKNSCPDCGSIRAKWLGSTAEKWGRLIRKKCHQCGRRYNIADRKVP